MTIPQHIKDRIEEWFSWMNPENKEHRFERHNRELDINFGYSLSTEELKTKDGRIKELESENERLRSRVAALKEPKDDNY